MGKEGHGRTGPVVRTAGSRVQGRRQPAYGRGADTARPGTDRFGQRVPADDRQARTHPCRVIPDRAGKGPCGDLFWQSGLDEGVDRGLKKHPRR